MKQKDKNRKTKPEKLMAELEAIIKQQNDIADSLEPEEETEEFHKKVSSISSQDMEKRFSI